MKYTNFTFAGRHHTEEAKEKCRIAKLGNTYSLGRKPTKEHKKRISESVYKYYQDHPRVFSEQHKENLRKAHWKGGKYKDRKGYILISNGRIREHRQIMEKYLGRKLEKWEEVHHINGVKDDNRIKNLAIMIRGFHKAKLRCPHCLKEVYIR